MALSLVAGEVTEYVNLLVVLGLAAYCSTWASRIAVGAVTMLGNVAVDMRDDNNNNGDDEDDDIDAVGTMAVSIDVGVGPSSWAAVVGCC